MDFRLFYRGDLKSNRGAADKHAIRKAFHAQLKDLWRQRPLYDVTGFFLDPSVTPNLLFPVGPFTFVPLVTERFGVIAKLEILFLRPEEPGSVITQGGDIDNRLKTLFDALKLPHEPDALPASASPGPDETPFFVLYQDDNLVTELSVVTDRLLEPVGSKSEVVLIIRVSTAVTQSNRANGVFA